MSNEDQGVAALQAADAANDGSVPLIQRIHAARIRQAGPIPAISEEAIQYILSAVHELPIEHLGFVSGGTPQAGELWRAGKHEALLVWVRKVFNDGIVDAIPVTFDVECADEATLLIPADATPIGCELAAMTTVRTHLDKSVFLGFVCALDIGAEIEEVIKASWQGRPAEGVRVGLPILSSEDQRIEYRCAIRDVLAHMSPDAAQPPTSEASPQ